MIKKEHIVLDAIIENVIGDAAFEAVLDNGHKLVAFLLPAEKEMAAEIKPGETVRVIVSPYDMSKGRILYKEGRKNHES